MTSSDLIERLQHLDSCAVSDALDSFGLPPGVTGIPAWSVRRRIAGRAVTVKLDSMRPEGAAVRHLCTAAVEAAGPGTVLVIEQKSGIDAAGWGGVLSQAARIAGIEGVIVEGPARDIDEARELEFPVYARSVTARTARGRIHEQGFNVAVSLGDLEVQPDDLIIADSSGVAVIPKNHATEIVEKAEFIAAREQAMTRDILKGEPVSKVMGASYETMLERKGQS